MSELAITYEICHKKIHSGVSGILAKYQGAIVGRAEFQIYGERLILSDIYVDPRFRRRGIGSKMLYSLAGLSEKKHLDFLFSFEGEGMKDPFYRFLASTHLFYLERQQGSTFSLSAEGMKRLCEQYPKNPKLEPMFFFERPHRMQEEFIHYLEPNYPEIAWELKHDPKDYRKDLSCCIVSDGQIQGACFIKEADGMLELKLLYGRIGKGTQTAKAMLYSLGELGEKEILPMKFSPLRESAMKIVEKMCPFRHLEKWVYVAYYKGKTGRG